MTDRAYSILLATDVTDSRAGDWMIAWADAAAGRHLLVPDMPALRDLDWWAKAIARHAAKLAPPVFLVARGLACHAVARWPTGDRAIWSGPIGGAMLVAPTVPQETDDAKGSGPVQPRPLPFPSVVVASRSDPKLPLRDAFALARSWGSHPVDGGDIGSGHEREPLESWGYGHHVLNWLVENVIDNREAAHGFDRTGNVVRLGVPRKAQARSI